MKRIAILAGSALLVLAAAAAQAADKVTIQLKWVTQAQFAGYYVAQDKGFYEAEGLDVTIKPGGPDVSPPQVIAGGGADIVIDWMPSALATREKGLMVEKIQAVEATATNSVFDPFAFKGVIVGHHMPRTIVRGIVHDGYRSFANGFDEIDGPSADWAVAGQVVGMLIGDEGDWQRFNNITSRPGNTLAWQLNTAFSAQANPDIYLGILESSFEGDGWNIYTSGYYRDTDEDFDDVGGQDLGFVFQGGMWTGRHTEIYTRYDITRPDSDRPEEGDSFRTITAGLNYYPKPHTDSIKFQGELLYMRDPEAESLVQPDTPTSVRASPDGGQFVIRTQAQLRW